MRWVLLTCITAMRMMVHGLPDGNKEAALLPQHLDSSSHQPVHSTLSWFSAEARGLTVLPAMDTNATVSEGSEIEGAVCTAAGVPTGGDVWPLFVIFITVCIILLLDYTDCFGVNVLEVIRGQQPLANSTTSTTSPDPTSADVGDSRSSTKETLLKDKPLDDAPPSTTTGDDSPTSIDLAGYILIAFTVVPGLVGDTYFTMLATFLPGVVDLRGMSGAISGLIFGCQPLGSLVTAPIVPWALRQEWGDPYVMLRLSSAFTAMAISVSGLLGKIPEDNLLPNQLAFTAVLCAMRFVQGACVTVMQVCNGQITLMLLPKDKIGPVQGIILATRILGVIAGPVLGGFLYSVRKVTSLLLLCLNAWVCL